MKTILRYCLFLSLICLFSTKINAQGNTVGSWSKNFEFQKAFIENKGQFLIPESFGNTNPVLFAVDHGGTKIYFTKKGITYTFLETSKKQKDARELERESREEFKNPEEYIRHEKEEHQLKTKSDQVTMLWKNANTNVEIEGSDITSDYHNYNYKQNDGDYKSVSNIKGYKKITYKNIYPNIDIEYVFHEKNGLKYSLTLHPGADPSVVKMVYDSHVSLNNNGDIRVSTKFGDIIDHAPLSFYQSNSSAVIGSNFIKNGKEVSFQLTNYDQTKTIIIDPWTQTPTFNTNWDCVWECEKDGAGNVYIIGGVMPLQLIKYNAAGTLQWTYNTAYDTTSWLGGFAVDNVGNAYVTNGTNPGIIKVNTAGVLQWTVGGGALAEYWEIAFNCDQTKLIVGGTDNLRGAIFDINTSNGAVTATKIVAYGSAFGIPPSIQEVRAITPCGNGRYYFLTLDSIGYINQNLTLCGPNNSAIYKTTSTHGFSYKCENYRYDNTGIMAIRADLNFVYTHNGTTLFKRSLANAAIIATVSIPGGAATTSLGQKAVSCSGIDIDAAGNIYVGSTNAVTKFSPALVQLGTVSVPFNVYDVHVSTGGDVIACGSTGNSSTNSRIGYIQSISSLTASNTLSLTCCDVNICQPSNVCSTAAAFNLQAATPGGTWSGTGITNSTNGTFSPATTGVGTHIISYSIACGVGTVAVTVLSCGTVTLCNNSGTLNVGGGSGTYTLASTSTSVSCASCPGGACIPFVCAGTTVPTWTASGTSVAAPASTVFPIKVTDIGTGITFTFTSLASIPACSTPSCPTLSLSVTSQTNVNCFGANTGTATISTSGGTGPYTYTWTPGNLSGPSQSNLTAGTYTIAIKDANNCTGTGTLTITQPTAALTAVITATTSSGCGVSTGGATVTASGGTTAYTYSWTPSGGTTAGVSNLATGSNSVTVTDAKGCTVTAVANITTVGGPTLSVASQANINCFGTNTGSATVNPTGGIGPYTYTWTPGNLSGASQSSLAAGTYTINVKDANLCTGTTTLTITQPTSAVTAVISSTTTTGCGASTGGATVTANGGTSSYTYSWTPSGGTIAGVSNLGVGNNTVIVTDANGCTVTAIANITTAGGPTLSVTSQTNINCFGANTGTATVNATGGTGPYTYTWTPGNLAGTTQTSLSAGTYTINTIDGNLCASSTTLVISQPTAALSSIISNSVAPGCGLSNGSATVTANGGTPGYTYSWSPNGGTTSSVSNLSSGTTTVTVTDSKGCITSSTLTINSVSGPTLNVVSQSSVACFGGNTGTATINATGGTGPYSYTWTPGNLSGTSQTSLSAGIYTITVKDANLCVGTGTLSITQPTSGVSGTINTSPTGCGTSVGSATVTANGGTPSYTYSWGPTTGTTTSISGLAAGNYSVLITDSKGCTATVNSSVGTSGTGPMLSIASQTNISCATASTQIGGATISATGTAPYTYTWSPSGGNAATATGLSAGTYTVFVNDASSCLSTISLTITQPPPIVLTLTSTPASCGSYDGTASITTSGGTGALSILWSVNSISTTITGLSAGTYSVLVTDATGCSATGFTNVNSVGTLTVDVGNNVTIFEGQSTPLIALIPFGANIVWTPTTGLSCTTCSNPIASPTITTDYCALTTVGSCTNISCVTVYVEVNCMSNSDYSVPNAFTPNGDGKNDQFCLEGWKKCVTSFYVSIYNKWGEKVFESDDADFCWDGKYKGNILNPDVFVYYIVASIKEVGDILRKGNVTLVK